MAEPLTEREVRHVARLARLRLSPDQIERYREQLASVLGHIAKLEKLDVSTIDPMAHPLQARCANRLDDDEPATPMPLDAVLANAPAVEGDYFAVPKVLGDGGGA